MDMQVELSVDNAGWGAMILSEMYAIRESSDTCDVTLVAADGSHIKAHSGVLSAASSFLMQLIQNAMKSNASSKEVVIRTSFSHAVVSNIVDFLYKGKTLPLMSQIAEIKTASKSFSITNLISLCDIFEAQHSTQFNSARKSQTVAKGQYSDLPHMQTASLRPEAGKSQSLTLNEMHNFDDDDDNGADINQEDLLGKIFTATDPQVVRKSTLTGCPSMDATDNGAKACAPAQSYPGPYLKTIGRKVGGSYVQKAKFNKKKHRYECDICHRIFSYKYRMTAHRAALHTGKRSKCDVCEKSFTYPESLYQHKKLHLGQSFECPHCDKSFKSLKRLRTHSTTHTKPFSCSFCNGRFANRPKMEEHERTHTGEKPFTCEDCGKQFRLKDSFNRHLRQNCCNTTNKTPQNVKTRKKEKRDGVTVEKSLECPTCGKICSSSSELKTHRTTHPLENKYFCNKDGCPGAFRLPAQIKRHIKLYHNDHTPIDIRDFKLMEAQVELSVENIGWGAMILSEMDALRENGQLCDITIMVKEGSTILAHSVVLSAASSFFKQVLEKTKKSASSTNSVVIKCGFTHAVISSVCDFLYKGKALPLLSQIPDIQRAAKVFGINSLQTLCQVFTAQDTFQASSAIADTNEQVIEEPSGEVSEIVLEEPTSTDAVGFEDEVVCEDEIPEPDNDDNIPVDVLPEDPTETVDSSILGGYSVVVAADGNTQPLDTAVVMRELQPEMIIGDYDVKTSNRKVYRYRCDLCPRVFTSKCRMEGHRATHLGDRIHKCTICGAGFIQSEYLREHMSVHSQARPHQCSICERSFRNARILKRHVFLHTGKKPFCCTICNAGFPRRDGLKNHMATHSNDKPFECSECGKAFSLMETLRRHMVLHSGNQPQHACKFCGNVYRRKNSLIQHMAIHTGERKHACNKEGCSAVFRLPAQLKRHIRLHGIDNVLNLERRKIIFPSSVDPQEIGAEQQVETDIGNTDSVRTVDSTVEAEADTTNIIAVIDTVTV